MALKMPLPSDQAREALQAGAALFTDNEAELTRLLIAAPVGLRLLTMTLADVQMRKLAPESDGWRFLASNSAGDFISGEVSPTKQGLRLTSVSRDPKAAEPFYAAKQMEQYGKVKEKDFMVSVLRVPGILLEALWLESDIDHEVLIVPVLTPTSDTLRRNIPTDVAQFFGTIEPLVSRFLQFDNYRRKPSSTQ